MYPYLLIIHNLTRWLVLLAGLYAVVRSISGIVKKSGYSGRDNAAHGLFVGICHLQLVLGLALYFVSPFVNEAFRLGIGKAMKEPELRFFAVEHVLVMFTAIILVQVGRAISKKQQDATARHKKALVFFCIGLLLILSRIPWHRVLWPL